jgi:hypothetical protein
MTSSYTTNKRLEKPANGDYVDLWNVPVNGDMDVIDQALGGVTSLNATAGSATLTYTQYRSLLITITGAISASVIYTIPSGVGGQWTVQNLTTDSVGGPWTVTFASGGGGTSVTADRNATAIINSDGTNVQYSDSRIQSAAGSTNQIQYNSGGLLAASATLVYNTSGNVGIGTASPSSGARLSINGGAGTSQTRFDVSTTTVAEISTNAAVSAYATRVYNAANHTWMINGSNSVYIDTSGNFGIGTGATTLSQKLQVAGTIYSSTGGFRFPDNTTQTSASVTTSLTAGTGISVSGATGNVTITNTGVTSAVAGTGISVSGATGGVTFTNTGVTSVAAGTGISVSAGTGGVTITATTSTTNTQVVYNSSGSLVGSSNLVFNGTTLTANTLGVTNNMTAGGSITATGNVTAYSDRSLKRDIQTIEHAVDLVKNLRGVTFEMINSGQKGVGVIAQEVQEHLPQVVQDNNGILSVAYGNLVGVLIEAVKELSNRIETLEKK